MFTDLSTENDLSFPLERRVLVLGREPSCDIRLKGVGVARFHARLHLAPDRVVIEDMEDSSGILLDGRLVHNESVPSGSMLTIGVNRLSLIMTPTSLIVRKVNDPEYSPIASSPASSGDITIGRDSGNSLHLSHPLVSRFHAVARMSGGEGIIIEDLGSTNGTFVNGKSIRRARIADDDIVHIGPYRFFCYLGKFHQAHDFNKIRLEAFTVTVVKKKHMLLQDISISILPGEFVAILGPSGSGKTTLAHTLMGQTQLHDGAIFYNGLPIKSFLSAFQSLIGFVSQENLLRPELSVMETFTEQSLLRLPRDSVSAERQERIRSVMDLLGLLPMAHCRIADLSGGEAKRVHFGIELLSSPTILFFDEPFAGLDPGLINKFMGLFRSLCDKGHTLLLTTHTLEQIDSCDRVLFMDRGKLVFSGAPKELLTNYNIASLPEVYEKIRSTPSLSIAPIARKRGKKMPLGLYKKSVLSPVKLFTARSASLKRQFLLLIARYVKTTLRDRKNCFLMLLQAPLIAFVLMWTYQPSLDGFPVSFYFCLSISAIWMGGMNSIREIAREWPVIAREFRIGLSPAIYCLSKISVFGCIGMFQAILFGYCLDFLFPRFALNFNIVLLLITACVSGALLGLCVSALSKNVNIAISWLPIIFIPQIFFSGVLVPFDEMSPMGRLLSSLTVSRYVFSMFKKACSLDQSLWQMSEWIGLFLLCIGLIILMIAGTMYSRLPAR
jgi:ABC transport system ATP-binding/permease protein